MTKMLQNAIKAVKPNVREHSKIPTAYDMSLDDLRELMKMSMTSDSGKICQAITSAFLFGFVMGNRATKARNLPRL